jgi:hypothetical protein
MEELRCIEAQIKEAISLEQKGGYERIHLQSVLREGLAHCQLLRRKLEEEYEQWHSTIKRDPVP